MKEISAICVCIKDGFLDIGEQFCIKGDHYDMYIEDVHQKYPYVVKTRSCNAHRMGKDFFFEHFMYLDDTWLEEDDFEI